MRKLFKSDFFLRFAGGFALGAAALVVVQPTAVAEGLSNLAQPAIERIA